MADPRSLPDQKKPEVGPEWDGHWALIGMLAFQLDDPGLACHMANSLERA